MHQQPQLYIEANIQALINQGVAAAMAEAEASRVRNGYDSNGSVPRPAQAARACSYSEFLKCKPLDFKGTEGVVGLTRWFEKMESVFSISNCPATEPIKFASALLQTMLLTWGNSHVKTTTPEDVPRRGLQPGSMQMGNAGANPTTSLRFEVIIGMDWLLKTVFLSTVLSRLFVIPPGAEILIVRVDRNSEGPRSDLTSSRVPSSKYLPQGSPRLFGTFTIKEIEEQSEKKHLRTNRYLKIFLMSYPEDLPGLPHTRQVDIQIDLYLWITIAYSLSPDWKANVLPDAFESGKTETTDSRKPENKQREIVGGMLIENVKFPEAIRTKVRTVERWNPILNGRSWVMLKVSPWKGVVRFGKQGKLNLRYVRPFKVLAKVGKVAYKLELPEELSRVHNTFHVSNLKKCHADEPLAVPLDGLHFDDKLQFVEEPIEITDREVKRLKRSRIPLVKVRWNSKRGPEFTWEREDQFRKKYPHLFSKTGPSSSAAS
ncbi:hypothetical protein Tco_0560805 [Tanacetum coccineum]